MAHIRQSRANFRLNLQVKVQIQGLSSESQGHNLALTVLYVPSSLEIEEAGLFARPPEILLLRLPPPPPGPLPAFWKIWHIYDSQALTFTESQS